MLMRCATLLTTLLLMSPPLLADHHGHSHEEAAPQQASEIEVAQPWARATPPGLRRAAVS